MNAIRLSKPVGAFWRKSTPAPALSISEQRTALAEGITDGSIPLDNHYQALWDKENTVDSLLKAGWIQETAPRQSFQGLNFYTADLNAVENNATAVLYYAGSNPSAELMLKAKTQLEETITAGFIVAHNAEQVESLETSLPKWLKLDCWPAYYVSEQLNITTMYDRFNRYLRTWLPEQKLKLYMVLDSTQRHLLPLFAEYGQAVLVEEDITSLFSPAVSHSDELCYLVDDLKQANILTNTGYPSHLISEALRIVLTSHSNEEAVQVSTPPIGDNENTINLSEFIIGVKSSSTQFSAFNQTTNMLPVLPYLSPAVRVKIPTNQAVSFSTEVWRLNYSLYKNTTLTVADVKHATDFTLIGFRPDQLISELCLKHILLLNS